MRLSVGVIGKVCAVVIHECLGPALPLFLPTICSCINVSIELHCICRSLLCPGYWGECECACRYGGGEEGRHQENGNFLKVALSCLKLS